MTEYKIANATVRIHGTVDQKKIKAATERFLKKAEAQKKSIHRRKGNEKNN